MGWHRSREGRQGKGAGAQVGAGREGRAYKEGRRQAVGCVVGEVGKIKWQAEEVGRSEVQGGRQSRDMRHYICLSNVHAVCHACLLVSGNKNPMPKCLGIRISSSSVISITLPRMN